MRDTIHMCCDKVGTNQEERKHALDEHPSRCQTNQILEMWSRRVRGRRRVTTFGQQASAPETDVKILQAEQQQQLSLELTGAILESSNQLHDSLI